jgi:hypothetical protein
MTQMKQLPTIAELTATADALRCPDGIRTPFNSAPLPTSRRALIALIADLQQYVAASRSLCR